MTTEENLTILNDLGINVETVTLNMEAHNIAEVKASLNNPNITKSDRFRDAENSSEFSSIPEETIIKTLIMILDDIGKVILLPGNKKIDFRKLRELTKAELMRMAEYDEVEKIGQVGAIFPFNVDVEVFIDQTLIQKEKVLMNVGTLKDYVFMPGKDLEKIKNSKIADLI